jgi:hypothetical protein
LFDALKRARVRITLPVEHVNGPDVHVVIGRFHIEERRIETGKTTHCGVSHLRQTPEPTRVTLVTLPDRLV